MPIMKICTCGKAIPKTVRCECKKKADRMRNKRRAQMKPEEKKFFNSKAWKVTRKKVIERDGAYCQRCLIKYNVITTRPLQVHHIKPRIKYNGTNGYPDLRFEPSNLVTLCQSCNTQFQTREQLDFDWQVPEEDDWVPVL